MSPFLSRASPAQEGASHGPARGRESSGSCAETLLLDLMMPDLDGVAFYEALSVRPPALLPRLAFLSGGAFGERATRFLAEHDVVVLAKPAPLPDLLRLIDRLASTVG